MVIRAFLINNMKRYLFLFFVTVLVPLSFALAHPGNTDSSGCHTCRTNCSNWGLSYGEYHCHNNKGSTQPIYPVTSTYGAYGTGYTSPAPSYAYPSSYSSTYSSCPANSYESGSSCKCNYGYVVSGSSCVSGNSYCWSKYGYSSSYDSLEKSCKCDSGYALGSSGQCEYQSKYSGLSTYTSATTYSCPANSYTSPTDSTKCRCDSGYRWNSDGDTCIKRTAKYNDEICQDDFGSKSEWSNEYKSDGNITCVCKSGYQWSTDGNSCKKILETASVNVTEATTTNITSGALTTSSAPVAVALFTRDLTVGSTGADVTALQIKLGVTPTTGYFGVVTKAAVMAYQTALGLTVTGYVDLATRLKLNN